MQIPETVTVRDIKCGLHATTNNCHDTARLVKQYIALDRQHTERELQQLSYHELKAMILGHPTNLKNLSTAEQLADAR